MDFYWKKIKTNKAPSAENVTNMIDEIDSKYMDMQPIIQESGDDILKAQRNISDIRGDIESLQRLEPTASHAEDERIKEICNKLKELLQSITKSLIKPQTPIQGSDSVQVTPSKISLMEMEEKLKSMRQKRLDRLSVFVTEQSRLSLERTGQGSEIEDAIKSMQQIPAEKTPSFKSLANENSLQHKAALLIKEEDDVPDPPKLNRNHSNESAAKSKFISKPSPRRKFIDKFNCTTNKSIGSSNEDLTKCTEEIHDYKPVYIKSKSIDNNIRSADAKDEFKRSSLTKDNRVKEVSDITDKGFHNNYNPLLSPVGKQRRAIYLYENESKFLDNIHREDMPHCEKFKKFTVDVSENTDFVAKKTEKPYLKTFLANKSDSTGKTDKEKDKINNKTDNNNIKNSFALSRFNIAPKSDSYLPSKLQDETKPTANPFFKNQKSNSFKETVQIAYSSSFEKRKAGDGVVINTKLNATNTYENHEVVNDKSEIIQDMKQVIKNTEEKETVEVSEEKVGNIRQVFESKIADLEATDLPRKFLKHAQNHSKINKKGHIPKLLINNENNNAKESMPSPVRVPRSPVPLPRNRNGERVLKKLQRNWEILNDITDNDSDVDCEELDDMKKSFEEASDLLEQYRAKIRKLDSKYSKCSEKISVINTQLHCIESDIRNFKGLRRDSSYKQLSSRLSNFFLDASKIKSSYIEVGNERKVVLDRIEWCVKTLENKATRNEALLMEVLQSQVRSIGTNCLNITAV